MKVALLLRGITSKKGYVHHFAKTVRDVCYKDTLQRILENVVVPLRDLHGADVYIATYGSQLEDHLLHDFYPTSGHVFLQGGLQMDCMLQGLRKIKQSACTYDVIFVCRFDLLLKCCITHMPFVWTKSNFLWHERTSGAMADCIHVFPGTHMDAWIHALEVCPIRTSIHYILPYLNVVEEERHVLLADVMESNTDKCDNPFYTIHRSRRVNSSFRDKLYRMVGKYAFFTV